METLKTWVTKNNILTIDLAAMMGISVSYASRILRGFRRLSPEKAIAFHQKNPEVPLMELLKKPLKEPLSIKEISHTVTRNKQKKPKNGEKYKKMHT